MSSEVRVEGESLVLPSGSPIVLVNLLKFNDIVDLEGSMVDGSVAYADYVSKIERALVDVGGRPVLTAKHGGNLLGNRGELWDELIVVWYPSGEAFQQFADSEICQAHLHLREAALSDSRLMAFTSPRRLGRLTAAVFALTVRLRRR